MFTEKFSPMNLGKAALNKVTGCLPCMTPLLDTETLQLQGQREYTVSLHLPGQHAIFQ